MGMTVTEKIIAVHCGKASVSPGEFVYADVDIALGNDITAPLAIAEFRNAGVTRVYDREKVVLIPDHFTPNKDIKSAGQSKILRDFAHEQELKHYYEVGRMGVEHALLPEQGIVVPGDLIIGADSHTCTYGALCAFATGVGSTDLAAVMATGKVWLRVPETRKFVYRGKLGRWVGGKDLILFTIGQIGVDGALYQAIEFTGDAIDTLPMDGRLTMTNMVIECGGKNGIIPFDEITKAYVTGRAQRDWHVFAADDDADYVDVTEWDVSDLEPQVAAPSLPSNVHPVRELSDVKIDQAVVGSCTNGRLSDIAVAAEIVKGKKVAPGVRMIVIPATQAVYLESIRRGYTETFVEAGAVVSTPTCGPCLGGHMGILAEGEVAVATTNRNFVGRMGHPGSGVYLAGPAVAAASALTGKITHPADV
ncbi:MAG TPA: 3-isopropylmalate dehydratase large subunit [Planctomycetota bacterium]|nr:3-isopropylmalate dehydratase large subunit [Planctomycetota bacterium]